MDGVGNISISHAVSTQIARFVVTTDKSVKFLFILITYLDVSDDDFS